MPPIIPTNAYLHHEYGKAKENGGEVEAKAHHRHRQSGLSPHTHPAQRMNESEHRRPGTGKEGESGRGGE